MNFVVICWMFFTLQTLYNIIILFSIHIANKNIHKFLCIVYNLCHAVPYCYFFNNNGNRSVFSVSEGIRLSEQTAVPETVEPPPFASAADIVNKITFPFASVITVPLQILSLHIY